MEGKSVPPGSLYFYYPRPICIVGIQDQARGTPNFMPVVWASPVASRPPLFAVCLSPKTYSHGLLMKTREFTVSFLPWEKVELVARLGSVSGRDTDKVKAFSLELADGEFVKTPYLKEAYVAAECSLVEHRSFGEETLFIGEVLKIIAKNGTFDEQGVLRLDRVAPVLYVGGNQYATVDPGTLQMFPGEKLNRTSPKDTL